MKAKACMKPAFLIFTGSFGAPSLLSVDVERDTMGIQGTATNFFTATWASMGQLSQFPLILH
ncbi:hypothetical protein C6W91_17365 [Phaeobacter sp. SYSU ZJ3003]|jgi:hypothetical protein